MKPPVLRPSSLPALAQCPRYSPAQDQDVEQKQSGTNRHTALGLYLADDPGWRDNIGGWDAGGVEWAGEYIRTHAPISTYQLEMEIPCEVTLSNFEIFRGTPDCACGPVLFDLKGRDIDTYEEQMAGYVLLRWWPESEVHVLYATERRASVFRMTREEAEEIVERIAEEVANPKSEPKLCDWCSWCANRKACPAFAASGAVGASNLGLTIPPGNIEDIVDADSLAQLKRAADAVAEWSKQAKAHVLEMATHRGVVPTGFRLASRKGNPSITDAWAAIQAAGLDPETVGKLLTINLGDLVEAYKEARKVSEAAAKRDIESRLGPLLSRAPDVRYLKSI